MTYLVKETREFYGPKKTAELVTDYWGDPETFPTREAAQARIAELDAAPYFASHNESSRPEYSVVKKKAQTC